ASLCPQGQSVDLFRPLGNRLARSCCRRQRQGGGSQRCQVRPRSPCRVTTTSPTPGWTPTKPRSVVVSPTDDKALPPTNAGRDPTTTDVLNAVRDLHAELARLLSKADVTAALPELLNDAQVAALLGISRSSFRRMVSSGAAPSGVRVGRYRKWQA